MVDSSRTQVAEAVADVVGSAVESMDSPLMESGLDSLGAVELRNSLAGRFGVELPATVTLDYPSISALAAFIASLMAPAGGARKPRLGRRPKGRRAEVGTQLIDIVGASCVYPGDDSSLSHAHLSLNGM
jgi:acyl carrier protein